MLLFVIMIAAISQTNIDVAQEQISLIQTITLSFIAINISLLLFILPSLANKRDACKEVLASMEEGEVKEEKQAQLTVLSQVVNMILLQNFCSFIILLASTFAIIFITDSILKFAFLISSLLIQSSYFLNLLMWLFFIYWQPVNANKKRRKIIKCTLKIKIFKKIDIKILDI